MSLAPGTGRCAILFPHGVLFRQEEAEMRRKIIEADLIDCVLGLGPNLFYNSPMEACIVVCRMTKPRKRKNRILFINAVNEVTRERAQSFLTDEHIGRIATAYRDFRNEPGFARAATLEEIRAKEGNLSIPFYVANGSSAAEVRDASTSAGADGRKDALENWLESSNRARETLNTVLEGQAAGTSDNHPINSVNHAIRLPSLDSRQPNPDWARLPIFDRRGWKRTRFGDVVENLNETERSPAEAGIERFIGLEHLEPGSLHVRSCGNVAEGITFTRRCRPGQVLFGKRRAYQRKVAVAEFEAVVSGDIYVLASRNDRLLPELLPFLCMSERFFQHAVGTSAGSLSPRTNWSSLASFEFDLPPFDQQRRIAEILWAVDQDERQKIEVWINTQDLLEAEIEKELDLLFEGPYEPLQKVLLGSPESGCSASPSPTDTGHFVLSLAALSRHGYVRGNLKPVPPTKAMSACRLSIDDFLISRSNTQELVGLVGIFDEDRGDVSFPDTMMRLPVNEARISKRFLEMVLQSRRGRLHMMRSAAGTSGSMKKINRHTLGSCLVPAPALEVQWQVLDKLKRVRESINSTRIAFSSASAMKTILLESLFRATAPRT